MERTLVAVLGTLADFHHEAIPYNLAALIRLMTDLKPDLLCLDITTEQWQRREFAELPPEYQEALLPVAHQTDIVVVPVAGDLPPEMPPPLAGAVRFWTYYGAGWRKWTASGMPTPNT